MVRHSGGYVWVYSEPGRGTTFKIYLPRVPEDASVSSGTETILLVEDSKLLAKVTRDFLALAGYRVLVAAEASEAFRVAAEYSGRIHLLLTDVVVPHMNGRELSELLLKKRPEMKVLFMSGHTAGVISQNVLLDEDVAFLEKPFAQNALARKIRQLLEPVT